MDLCDSRPLRMGLSSVLESAILEVINEKHKL